MNKKEAIAYVESPDLRPIMEALYREETEKNIARYQGLIEKFSEAFGDREISLFTSPGRTEIGGNHTDHNYGKVLAGSINLDCIGIASPNEDRIVRIINETFEQDITISLENLEPSGKNSGTEDLVKGVITGVEHFGYHVGGFYLYTDSTVISAAGVSSSASFEMLLCSILDTFYNEGKMDIVSYAHIGQFSEHKYWNKASGLLDQMACAAGGFVTIDFKNPKEPVVEKIDFDFAAQEYKLIIVNTGKGHADLSEDYSLVPEEMKKVAAYFGKEVCAEISEEEVISDLAKVREAAGDRSVLRALHFFEENKRVEAQVAALKENRFQDFLSHITASGNSSWKWLQNCYTNHAYQEQGITVALALTELFLTKKGCGACRVHGGGFAGVIMVLLPKAQVEEYVEYIENAIGKGNAYRMNIRPYGAVCLNAAAITVQP